MKQFLEKKGRRGVIVSTDDEGSQSVCGPHERRNLSNGAVKISIGGKKVGELRPHPEDREIFTFKPEAGVEVFVEDHLREEMSREAERKARPRPKPEAVSIKDLPRDFLRRPPPKQKHSKDALLMASFSFKQKTAPPRTRGDAG